MVGDCIVQFINTMSFGTLLYIAKENVRISGHYEVEKQVADLTGLNQQAKGLYRDENVYEDADIQMAGYAAALRVLTRYTVIDGRDMTAEMSEGSELYQSTLRAVLYGLMELQKDVDGAEVLAHLTLNVPNYYGDMTQRELVVELAGYLAKRLEALRPAEASAARVLRELVKRHRLG